MAGADPDGQSSESIQRPLQQGAEGPQHPVLGTGGRRKQLSRSGGAGLFPRPGAHQEEGGRGTANYFGLEDDVDIYMGTFSKSLASLGGYMAADAKVVDYVRHSARPYMFAASIPPAQTAVALASLRYLEAHPELPEKLQNNAARFRKNLIDRDVAIIEAPTPIVPIYTYSAENTLLKQKNMYEEGVYVNSVLPPACAPGECLLRTSLMASHTDELIDEASDIIAKVMHHDDSEILAQLKFER